MINKGKRPEKKEKFIEEAIARLVERGHENIKADAKEWESPSRMINQSSGVEFTPDITAVKNGKKVYGEIAHKTPDERKLVTKWRLLETVARMRKGAFKIFVPRGHMKFTRELLSRYDMETELVKMY